MESRLASNSQDEDSLSGLATVSLQYDEWIPAADWLSMFVPIVLKGTDVAGRSFIEHCQTVLISKKGLKTKSMQALAVGGRLQIAVPSRQRVSWATIAWLGEKKTDGQEIGIAVEQNNDFWGVPFPTNALDPNFARPATEEKHTMVTTESLQMAMNQAPRQQVESMVQSGSGDAQRGSSDKLSGALRELADNAIRETLQEALKTLRERADEIQSRTNNDFALQLHGHVEQALSVAMERMEICSAELISRRRQDWEQDLQSLCNSAEERLKAQLAEQAKCLAADSEKVCNNLAQRLADASDVLKGNREIRE